MTSFASQSDQGRQANCPTTAIGWPAPSDPKQKFTAPRIKSKADVASLGQLIAKSESRPRCRRFRTLPKPKALFSFDRGTWCSTASKPRTPDPGQTQVSRTAAAPRKDRSLPVESSIRALRHSARELSVEFQEVVLKAAARPGPSDDIQPLPEGLRAGKNSQAYRAHSYHTKVPPEAIEKLIRHHTSEGSHVGLCDPHPAA